LASEDVIAPLIYLEVCFSLCYHLANSGILQEIQGKEVRSIIVEYSSYDYPYKPEGKLVGWERSIQ